MDHKSSSGYQTRESQAISNLFDSYASRAQSRRSNVRAAEIVDHAANSNVDCSYGTLAYQQCPSEMLRLAHFRSDREESRSAGVGKDERRHCRDGFGKRWVVGDFEVGFPGTFPGRSVRSVLDTNGNGDDKD